MQSIQGPGQPFRHVVRRLSALALIVLFFPCADKAAPVWSGYAGDAQHTAVSAVASQSLLSIRWHTAVDLNPQYSGNDLLIHYGSPMVTQANTVIVPVKTGAAGGFQVSAFNGLNGAAKWSQTSDYILPPHNWVPSFSPTLTPTQRLYFPGAGGTVYYRDAVDASGSAPVTQLAFYGLANYTAGKSAYDGGVFINTPITSDSGGNIYFGFQVTGSTPQNLQSGIARIAADGTSTWISAAAAATGAGIIKVVQNCAPALSNDGQTLYVAVNNANGTFGPTGSLLALNATTLAPQAKVALNSVQPNQAAYLADDGTASPTVGPNGDVYIGVLDSPAFANHDRGWLLHFTSDLKATRTVNSVTTPLANGAFGWDDTASVVPASMVASYHGSSPYLLMTKYNNYAGEGGDGVNKIAILDPSATQVDSVSGATVMKEVLTISGVTPDPEFIGSHPNAVREWCINTAVVDPATDSVLANSEDGKLYRWNLGTNTFTEVITLTPGIGEAYTPTLIGADGTVYAINNATLFAIGVPEPTLIVVPIVTAMLLKRPRRRII